VRRINKKIVWFGAFVVFLISIFLLFLLTRPGAEIVVFTSPISSLITIDQGKGRSFASGDTFDVSPGRHTITVSHDGFSNLTFDVVIKKGEVRNLYMPLPVGEKLNSAIQSTEEQTNRESVYSDGMAYDAKFIREENPILSQLPYYGPDYTISQVASTRIHNPYASGVGIQANTPQARQSALKKIRALGYDPSDYEIIFSELILPGNYDE
jgi:hypothetical protein